MIRRVLTLSMSLVLALFVVPRPAPGQASGWAGAGLAQTVVGQRNWIGMSLAQMIESARWAIGALRINAAFELTNAGYDSNIFYGYYGEAVPDLTAAASVPVQTLMSLSRRVVLELYDNPQYMFYKDTEQERTWNNVFWGRLHFASDRLYFQAGGGLSNVRQLLSPEVTVNVQQKAARLNGTMLWQLSRTVSLAALYERSELDYGNTTAGGINFAQNLNRTENAFDVVAFLQASAGIRLYIDGQYGQYEFQNAASSFKNTRGYSLCGGAVFAPPDGLVRLVEPLQGNFSLGYKRFDIIDHLFGDGSSLIGSVNLSVGLFRLTSSRAFFSRDFVFSAYSSRTFFLSTIYGVGLSRRLSRRAMLSYDLTFTRSAYPKAELAGTPIGENSRYATHSINLGLKIARYLEVGVQGIFSRRAIDLQGLVTNRSYIGIRLVYGSPPVTIATPATTLSR